MYTCKLISQSLEITLSNLSINRSSLICLISFFTLNNNINNNKNKKFK